MVKKTGKFKSKGSNILKCQQWPGSMKDFIEETSFAEGFENDVQIHKDAEAHSHISTDTQNHSPDDKYFDKDKLERIHLQIRKDLADKLYEIVFKRKRNPEFKRKDATQRAIIEEALNEYFLNQGM